MTDNEFLQHFPGATQTQPGHFMAPCPGHKDRTPSLSIKLLDDRRLLYCFAGCDIDRILAAVGLTKRDLFTNETPPTPRQGRRRTRVRDYDYTDREGQPLLRVTRWNPKSFTRSLLNGQSDTSGILALYRWPRVAHACASHETVLFCEGEKDSEAIETLGFVATTALGGSSKWDDDFYPREFVGAAEVIVIADRDTEANGFKGQRFAATVRDALLSHGVNARAVVLPAEINGKPVKDSADFITATNNDRAAFEAAIAPMDWDCYINSLPTPKSEERRAQPDLTMAEYVAQDLDDPERPNPAQVCKRMMSWMTEPAHGKWLRADGRAPAYFYEAEKRVYRSDDPCFVPWLFSQVFYPRTGKVGREIIDSFVSHPLALVDPRAVDVEFCSFWHRNSGAVYLSNGLDGLVRITAKTIDTDLANGTDGVFFEETLPAWQLVRDTTSPLDLRIFAEASCGTPGVKLAILWLLFQLLGYQKRPVLALLGAVAAGKTSFACALQAILGVPQRQMTPTRNGERDFDAAVSKGGLVVWDNVDSALPPWAQDALDFVATGGVRTVRRLFSTAEALAIKPDAGLMVTSADAQFAGRASTASRLLPVDFEPAPKRQSRDAELFKEIVEKRDGLMTWIAVTIQRALREPLPDCSTRSRHPDFVREALRFGKVLGWDDTTDILHAVEDRKVSLVFENNYLYLAPLAELMSLSGKPVTGTAAQILELMKCENLYSTFDENRVSAISFGRLLAKSMPDLEKKFRATVKRERGGRVVYTLHPQQENVEASSSATPAKSPATPKAQLEGIAVDGGASSRPSVSAAERKLALSLAKNEFPIHPWTPADSLA